MRGGGGPIEGASAFSWGAKKKGDWDIGGEEKGGGGGWEKRF